MRIAVQPWAPDYGAELDLGAPENVTVADVDTTCETTRWGPLDAGDPAPFDNERIGFVDGTRRTDARVFVSHNGSAPYPGLAGSVAVGSVVCDLPRVFNGAGARRGATVRDVEVRRWLAIGGGRKATIIAGPGLEYRALPVPGYALEDLVGAVHQQMRNAEADAAVGLAQDGMLVFADGPLALMNPGPRRVVGLIKSHDRRYLPSEEERLLVELDCGQRTPLFCFGGPHRPRYSWYLRLCAPDSAAHGWHGLVRCEAPGQLPASDAVALAGASAALLPWYASAPYWDRRAPQNLVPVAGLERRLRHLLGDRDLAYRRIRSAANRGSGTE